MTRILVAIAMTLMGFGWLFYLDWKTASAIVCIYWGLTIINDKDEQGIEGFNKPDN